MRFLKVMTFTEPHKVLKACRAALSEGFDVIYLESDSHIAGWYLADAITLLNGGSQWCGNRAPHMRNCLDLYSVKHEKFYECLAQILCSGSDWDRAYTRNLTDFSVLGAPSLKRIYIDTNIDHSVRATRLLLDGVPT